jgi:hypothetical protein
MPAADPGHPPIPATCLYRRRLLSDAADAATTIVDPTSDGVSDSLEKVFFSNTILALSYAL